MTSRAALLSPRLGKAGFVVLLSLLSGCATATTPPAVTSPASPPSPVSAVAAIDSPPQWRAGDRWTYGWTAGSETGTKTVEVVELREVNRVMFYIVRVGDLTHFYTRELQWAASMRDQRVDSRMTPPLPWFAWPLESGRHWVHQGTYEDANGKTAASDRFSVAGVETVEVPAGRFQAVKVVRETDRKDLDQYWYAPEVGFYVKWVGRRGTAQFEEQLQEYRRMPPADSSHPTPTPPSTTR